MVRGCKTEGNTTCACIVLTLVGILLWLLLRTARRNFVLNQNGHCYVLMGENMLGWHSGASQTYSFYEMQLFCVFFSVVTFRYVQAYDNLIFSLELICKSEFDPYQL